ncbi:MAG: hypothetical protein WC532_05205 [Candidatus Omnitrophota bacterium]
MKKAVIALIVLVVAAAFTWLFLYNGIGRYKSMVFATNNSKNAEKLKAGMVKSEVLTIMGPPNKVEIYSVNGQILEFLLYRTKAFDFFFKDKEANFLPVAVDNTSGRVLSLDRSFYLETRK